MPLTLAEKDMDLVIKRIGGKPEVKQHLVDIGFVAGGMVKVLASLGGDLIVNVKGARIALSSELACKIFV